MDTTNIMWNPTKSQIQNSQMTEFTEFVNFKYKLKLKDYNELHSWSVENIADFWQSFWEYSKIIHSSKIDSVVDDESKMPGAKWFTGVKLNFAENLLRYRNDDIAIISKGESRKPH